MDDEVCVAVEWESQLKKQLWSKRIVMRLLQEEKGKHERDRKMKMFPIDKKWICKEVFNLLMWLRK